MDQSGKKLGEEPQQKVMSADQALKAELLDDPLLSDDKMAKLKGHLLEVYNYANVNCRSDSCTCVKRFLPLNFVDFSSFCLA